jgi:radical SAM superfamily enzyme YgiQ (UPF0313 family)
MKIALISPRGAERNQQNHILNTVYRKLSRYVSFLEDDIEFMPNLGLLTIAGFIPREHELHYIDEDYIDIRQIEKIIFDPSYDLVLVTAVNNQAVRAYEICDKFRELQVPVLLGGMHASSRPEEAKEHADFVVVGEGEDTFPEFFKDFLMGRPKEIYISAGNFDLTKTPMPRFDIINNIRRYNKMSVQATRGCPHSCKFCSIIKVYGRKFRTKTPEQVVAEIQEIHRIYPRAFISFADENMMINRQFAKDLCRALIPLKIKFEAYCDVAVYEDEELLSLLSKAGCIQLLIGYESIEEESLKEVGEWKASMRPHYEESIRVIQSYGITILALFIIGFDGDTPKTFQKLKKFLVETNMYDVDFSVLTPIPGTDFYERVRAEGRLLSEDWDMYTWQNVNYRPKQMTSRELWEGIMWLFKEFNTPEMLKRRRQYFKEIISRLRDEGEEIPHLRGRHISLPAADRQ